MTSVPFLTIVHVCAGLEETGGGMSELIPSFIREQAKQGHQVTLVFTCAGEKVSGLERPGAMIRSFRRSFPVFLFFSWRLLFYLPGIVRLADVVHVHSNWTFPVWYAGILALWFGKPLVMSPHGCLDPVRLRHSAWKKRMVAWIDRFLLSHADVVHVISVAEQNWCKAFVPGIRSFLVQPYGVNDCPVQLSERPAFEEGDPRIVLYLGRLHPLKGGDLLIHAWCALFPEISEKWRLLIVGPDEQCCLAGLKMLSGSRSDIVFGETVVGDGKWNLLMQADVFVLPSRSENMGIVVGEALLAEVPVLTTDATPWRDFGAEDFLVSVPVSEDCIKVALAAMLALSDEERAAMGRRGRKWVLRNFSWTSASEHLVREYSKLTKSKGKTNETNET